MPCDCCDTQTPADKKKHSVDPGSHFLLQLARSVTKSKNSIKMSMIMKSSVSKAAVKVSAPKANKMMVWQPYNNK